ncbi:hypothetical protein DFO62_101382 [Serratia fonticola]|nr:hypothetical protein DFO62_101382 [Serratia fonticola]
MTVLLSILSWSLSCMLNALIFSSWFRILRVVNQSKVPKNEPICSIWQQTHFSLTLVL